MPLSNAKWHGHLQSLVRGEGRVDNQFPFDDSSELGVFFKDGLHVQDGPRKPDLWQQQGEASEGEKQA